MRINDFKATDDKDKKELEKKLNSFKLEKVLSLWYFVRSSGKATIVGSKSQITVEEMPLNSLKRSLEVFPL